MSCQSPEDQLGVEGRLTSAGFKVPGIQRVIIGLETLPDGVLALVVAVHGGTDPAMLPEKILQGLALQLGARRQPPEQGEILRWHLVP